MMAVRSSSSSKNPVNNRILLVDDNAVGLAARRMVLEELGYNITSITCPVEALAAFREQPFDVVVTDYKMPKMSGRELITALRAIDPSLPIIMISGYAETLGLTEKNTGATVVIMKSANEVQHLVRAVSRMLTPNAERKPPGGAAPKARRKSASS